MAPATFSMKRWHLPASSDKALAESNQIRRFFHCYLLYIDTDI
ncbi:hypothetical protein S7335_3572 [Synechococcus sp. PCC 7335]|nr:hypothetical protein S7335_3572 [Synechococcus sp. PCC 7335]